MLIKTTSTGGQYALLDIVCFVGMKEEEKQGDGDAFPELDKAPFGALFARWQSRLPVKGVDRPDMTGD